MKLLEASLEQIQRDVINRERTALSVQLVGAEDDEIPFIKTAQNLLDVSDVKK